MASNGKQRNSFFAEMRRSNNPNFYNSMSIDDLRKCVKRIVTDIKYGNISNEDYQYFLNEKVLMACLEESNSQMQAAAILLNALNFYINDGLRAGYIPYRTTDLAAEHVAATNEQLRQNNRWSLWRSIHTAFVCIQSGAEVITTLSGIQALNFKPSDLG